MDNGTIAFRQNRIDIKYPLFLKIEYWQCVYSLWNRDFSEALDIYSHKAVNQLESTFLALTNYELYVSEDLYDNYYEKIIKRTSKKKNKDKSTKDPSSDDGEEDEYWDRRDDQRDWY